MSQNLDQAKFLIKELLAILEIIPENKYDQELEELIYKLIQELKNEGITN